MNERQLAARAARQRAMVSNHEPGDDEPAERPPPAPPLPPFEDAVAAERARQFAALGLEDRPGIPVSYLRFADKTFQVPGMQSGDQLHAKAQANGRAHRIELIAGVNAFLVTYLDPTSRKIECEFVERTAVKTWRLA